MADTGAGTPLTAEEEATVVAALNNVVRVSHHYWPNGHHIETFAREAIAALDAARSRPATDPAGLDVALREVEDAAIGARPAWAAGARWAAKRIADATAARLSVADGPGPGPEERPSVEALAIALHSDGEDCPAEITWDRPCPGPSQHMERAARLRAALPVEETGR